MGNEIVDADEIKDEVALLREKLKARGTNTTELKPHLKTRTKSKPIKKDAGLKKGRRKEASSNEVMVWINKGRKYGPKNEQKALECYEKAEELKPSWYLIYKDRAKLFHMLKKFENAASCLTSSFVSSFKTLAIYCTLSSPPMSTRIQVARQRIT